MFAISPTDINWFNFLKANSLNSYVNFWTPTPWNIKGLKENDRLYFMLKKPIRKIGGFGEFVEYKNITVEEAWNEFGYRNGRNSKKAFLQSIQKYIDRHSSAYGGKELDPLNYVIGCIVLRNCEFWDELQYRDSSNFDILFSSQIVKIKYYDGYDPITRIIEINNFGIVSEPRNDKKYLINKRDGQSVFKGKILKAYNNTCCVTGETVPELLEAAHIQEYRNVSSNHVQNGLLLRVDIHRLFDNNLIWIDGSYTIHVSSYVSNDYYRKLHGNKIYLPYLQSDYPSVDALELRKIEFRE